MQIWGNTAQTGSASSPLFTSLEKRCCRLKTLNRSEEWRNANIENAKQIFLKSTKSVSENTGRYTDKGKYKK